MPKKKTEEQEVQADELMDQLTIAMQAPQENNLVDVRMQMLSLAKDILERNAALQWEQDKTKGLTITVEEIIEEAKKLLSFILEE